MIGKKTTMNSLLFQWSPVIALLCAAVIPRIGLCEDPMDLLIVANKKVPVDQITVEELNSIFFRAKTTWPGGEKIEPINAPSGSQTREIFSLAVFGMHHRDELRKWENLRIMKGHRSPPELPSQEHERIRAVFSTPNSISYVLRKEFVPNVSKILLVLPHKKDPSP